MNQFKIALYVRLKSYKCHHEEMNDEKVNQLIIQRFYKITQDNVSWKKDGKRNSNLKINMRNGGLINEKTKDWTNNQSSNTIQNS